MGRRAKDHRQKLQKEAEHHWLIPVILVTQEAEIRKIVVQSQPEKIIH
jgi:hypothetical protein